ncbi:TPA: hypothetical protein KKL70_004850 [Escherichia coli]|nr:hypothetical protein [Escherichia coli]
MCHPMRHRVIAMYVLLLSGCDSHSARSYMPGAFACATALASCMTGFSASTISIPACTAFPVTTMTLAMIRRSYSTASLPRL